MTATLISMGGLAVAAPRDNAAQKKIEEAIYTHFLNTDFDKAEGILLGTIKACEDKCSPEVKAKAWMYVGVVRGSGKNDIAGAEEAFVNAIQTDPAVQLDDQIATEEVKAAFAKASQAAGGAAPAAEGAAEFACTLEVDQVESRRPIPIACGTPAELDSAHLYYKGFAQDWQSVEMEEVEGEWQATIPCSATGTTGELRYYLEGLDADEMVVAAAGNPEDPRTVEIVDETDAPPPALPGEDPPNRCEKGSVAAGGGACGNWGEPCGPDNCCDAGLACIEGTCEASQCLNDSDCDSGECVDGQCAVEEAAAGKGPKNWVGVHFGLDIASVSSDGACRPEARDDNFTCFDGSETYAGTPNENAPGSISSGFAPATMRAMASYERIFGPIGLEVRLGFAFNGGQTPKDGSAFLPIHAELRGKYWISGSDGFSKPGLRPWIHLGGGLAQVDVTVDVDILDCGSSPDASCLTAPVEAQPGERKTLEAKKAIGNSFATAGGGLMYAIAPNHGPLLNLNMMLLFPASGLVLEPSLGYAFGF